MRVLPVLAMFLRRASLAVARARGPARLPLLVTLALLGVLGAALLTDAPRSAQPSQEVDVLTAAADTGGLARIDSDHDGLSDLEEVIAGTDPHNPRTDGDPMGDAWQVRNARFDAANGTWCPDPLKPDAAATCDHDGLSILQDWQLGLDPHNPYIAGYPYTNGQVVACGLSPYHFDPAADPAGSGLTNAEKVRLGLRCDRSDSTLNGLTDYEKLFVYHTDPHRFSTSDCGIPDGWLVAWQMPLNDTALCFSQEHHPGLSNLQEYQWTYDHVVRPAAQACNCTPQGKELRALYAKGLDPRTDDTDHDGMPDAWEVKWGLDPLNFGRNPLLGPDGDPTGGGLTNLEKSRHGCNPFALDTAGSGLSDFVKVRGWNITVNGRTVHVHADCTRVDSAGSGLTDKEKFDGRAVRAGVVYDFPRLDPMTQDTDGDGLSDAQEVFSPCRGAAAPFRLDPTNSDTPGRGMTDGEAYRYWSARQNDSGPQADAVLDRLAAQMSADRGGASVSREDARKALGPCGDVTGKGQPNILNRDTDGDGIRDGDELHPPAKAVAPGSHATRRLPATDPALRDTDGDKLPDDWEDKYAVYDFALGDWNLNASKADSLNLRDGKTDAERDLDHDGVHDNGTGYAHRVGFDFTNFGEYLAGTDPNAVDTDNDALPDGWEVYFGCISNPVPSRVCAGLGLQFDPTTDIRVAFDPNDVVAPGSVPDGEKTGKSQAYTRFVKADSAGAARALLDANRTESFGACDNTGQSDQACDLFSGGIVRIHGVFNLTYARELQLRLDPTRTSTVGDGIPDAWKVLYGLDPLDPGLAGANAPGGSGLTVLQAYQRHCDPTKLDTNLGGLPDKDAPDCQYPPADLPNGDATCNGVPNKDKVARGLSLSEPDTDHDGLLDGPGVAFFEDTQGHVVLARNVVATPGCTLSLDQLRQRFIDLGIAEIVTDRGVLFLGEDMFGTDPRNPDTDGDGLPDGWEAYWYYRHGVQSSTPDPLNSGPIGAGDGVNETTKYRAGMPAGWENSGCGPWWFGLDPRSPDTNGDGVTDGAVTGGVAVGGPDRDLNNNGLDDADGEDPSPVYDHNGTLPGLLGDCAAYHRWVERWVFRDGRAGTAALDTTGDGVPDRLNFAATRLTGLSADLDPEGRLPPAERSHALLKGANFTVHGRVVVAGGADDGKPVPGVVVVVRLAASGQASAPGSTRDTLGVAMSGSDGGFVVQGAVAAARSATLPLDGVVFGMRVPAGGAVAWAPDTRALLPDAGYRLVVTALGRATGPGGQAYRFAAPRPGGGAFAARGVHGASVTSDPGNADLPLPLLSLESASQLRLPAGLNVTAGEALHVAGAVVDALGDPVPARFLQGGALRVTWLGEVLSAPPEVAVRDGGFDLALRVDANTSLGAHPLDVVYDGSGSLLQGSRASATVEVRYPTSITGRVTNADLTAVAGEDVAVAGRVVDFHGAAVPPGLPVVATLEGTTLAGATGADGAFDIHGLVPTGAGVGTQAVRVEFPGSAAYGSSAADAGFVTVRQRTVLGLDAGNASLGRDLVVSGTLRDLAGNAVDDPTAGGNATVRVASPVLAGEVNVTGDRFSFVIPRDALPGAGPLRVKASFPGSPLYVGTEASADVLVHSRTALTLLPGAVVRGGDGSVLGSLTDERGRGVPGAMVDVRVGNLSVRVPTSANGSFSAPVRLPADAALGGVVARASFPGGLDGLLEAAPDATAVLQVLAGTRLAVPERTAPLDAALPVAGTLRDDAGSGVPGARLEALLDGVPLGSPITDAQGAFAWDLAAPPGTRPGPHVLTVRFPGSGTLAPAQADAPYRLLAGSRLALLDAPGLVRDAPATLHARLTDAAGAPLPGRVVTLRLAGAPVGEGVTAADGTVALPARPPPWLGPGNVSVEAAFAGDEGYEAAAVRAESPLLVRTDLQVALPAEVDHGQLFQGTVLLRDDAGRPLGAQPVVLRFTGFRFPLVLLTDAAGRANFTARMQGPGVGEVRAQFPGGPGLAPAEGSLEVRSRAAVLETGAGVAGAALLVAAAAVGTGVLALRRRVRTRAAGLERVLGEAEERLLASTEHQASILWCYRRLTEHLRTHGLLAGASATPREVLEAMAAAVPLSRPPLERLVEAFEEARYSTHPVGQVERDRALLALREVERELRAARGARRTSGDGA